MFKLVQKFLKKVKSKFRLNSLRPAAYQFFCNHFSVEKKLVLIESFHGEGISDSGLEFAKEMTRSWPGKYKIYFASDDLETHGSFIKKIGLEIRLVDVRYFKYQKILATAEYIFSNASLPIHFSKRKGQTYMQTWHGTPLKTLGKKMRLGIESMNMPQHSFLQADYLTEPNEFTKNVIVEDYLLENLYTGKIVMAGYPRNRVFMVPEEGKSLRASLGLEDKEIYIYMPTWRGASNHTVQTRAYVKEVNTILQTLDEYLKDDQILFARFHPLLHGAVPLEGYAHIRPFPPNVETYLFLSSADALITDYSSVFFDFSLTKKPIILFMYDYEEYMAERGMNFDVGTLPFPKVYDTQDLGEMLRDGTFKGDDYSDTEYFNTYFKYDAPDTTLRLLRLVLEGDDSGLKIYDYSHNKEKKYKVLLPKSIKKYYHFNTISKCIDENTIVLLYKHWFKGEISPTLHDYFNDSFTYAMTTITRPMTWFERFCLNLQSKKMEDKLHRRDIERIFPGLDINPEFITDYGKIEEGFVSAKEQQTVFCPGTVEKGDGSVVVISFSGPDGMAFEDAAIERTDGCLIARRPLAKRELEERKIYFNLRDLIEDLTVYRGEQIRFCAIVRLENGEKKVALFVDEEKFEYAKTKDEGKNRLNFCYDIQTDEYNLPKDYFKTNLRNIKESVNELRRESIKAYNLEAEPKALSVIPYVEKYDGFVKAELFDSKQVFRYLNVRAKLVSISTSKNGFKVKAFLPRLAPRYVTGAKLIYRSSTQEIEIPLESSVRGDEEGSNILIFGKFSEDDPFKEIYWDIRIAVRVFDTDGNIRIGVGKKSQRLLFMLKNYQCEIDGENILFPYMGRGKELCFVYRKKTDFDNTATRLREMTAFGLYLLLMPYFKMRKIMVVFEKYSRSAQDNGYYFFKYCMENLPESEKRNIFYVIDKSSPDYANVERYGKNVVSFMSMRHMLLALAMRVCVATDNVNHLYIWRTKPSIIYRTIKKKKNEMFLQHGVTALKKTHVYFGKRSANPMKYFVTTAEKEQDIVVNFYGYSRESAPILGFCRWDVFENRRDDRDRFILVMPTWRSWLEEVGDDVFVESEYYMKYLDFLSDKYFNQILEKHGLKAVFYLHPKFADFIHNFPGEISSRVSCIPFGEVALNELMMKCQLLVTDYSSVCWDVWYLEKPVLFYQFDYERYATEHGSYIDMTMDLYGERSTELKPLLENIEEYASRDFQMKPIYKELVEEFFEYKDSDNSKRTYEFLRDMVM